MSPAARVTYHHICTLSSANNEFRACDTDEPAGVCRIKTNAIINALKNNNKATKNTPRMILSIADSSLELLVDIFVLIDILLAIRRTMQGSLAVHHKINDVVVCGQLLDLSRSAD